MSGRRRRRPLAPLVALVATLLLVGCGDDDVESGADAGAPAATFVGTITEVTAFEPVLEECTPADEVDPDGSVSSDDPPVCTDEATAPQGSILVEVEPEADTGEKIVFTILQETVITQDGDPASFADLAAGQEATIGYSGQVAQSYPGQAAAESVEISGPS